MSSGLAALAVADARGCSLSLGMCAPSFGTYAPLSKAYAPWCRACAPSPRMCRARCCLGRARRRLGCARHHLGCAPSFGTCALGPLWPRPGFEYLAGGGATHLRRRAHSSTLCLPSILLPLVCVHRRSIGCTWR